MSETVVSPDYTRDRAVALICECYNNCGASLEPQVIKKSLIADSLGEIPEAWNTGLFRFLDESIYLIKLLGYFSLADALKKPKRRSVFILLHQLEKTLLAVRVLSGAGLDGSARQNLRSLLEICEALCRAIVDEEFCQDFAEPTSSEEANHFWHKNTSKGKTTKFLRRYNEKAEIKCGLVLDDFFENARTMSGLTVHPNFFGWNMDFERDWKHQGISKSKDEMFAFEPAVASELVLATASQLALITTDFYAKQLAATLSTLGLLDENPVFKHLGTDSEKIEAVGRSATLMFLMLCKLVNRSKPNFDPGIHF